LEEHIASIFRVEEIGSAKPTSKHLATCKLEGMWKDYLRYWSWHLSGLNKGNRTSHTLAIPNKLRNVGFQTLTAVIMKSTIFWDITPCSPLKVKGRFRGAYCLHLQG
jgi:hypothetical protein